LADEQLFGGLPAFNDLRPWRTWLVFLTAVYGLPLSDLLPFGLSEDEALAIFVKHTGRTSYAPPLGGYAESVAVVGRQGGKDRIGSAIQAYEAMIATPEADGTDLYSVSVCQDARASLRTQFSYACAPFRQIPMLRQLVTAERSDTLELSTGIVLASYPCRPQAVRGLRANVVICSELAFFRSTDGNPTDEEMLRAVRPMLATTKGKLVIFSSPYSQSGALYELHRKHHGKDESMTLVWQATAPEMNPTLPIDYLKRMEQDDPEAYQSEVLGEFRSGTALFIDANAIAACVAEDVRERAPVAGKLYFGFVDPSGGRNDAFTAAIAHAEGDRVVLDAVRVTVPPFNPTGVIAEFVDLFRRYRVTQVMGDRYAADFVSEQFRVHGVRYQASDRDRSAIYLELLPLINAERVVLLDVPELLREIRGLERRRGATGRDRIDHAPGRHDDLANAAAGALISASQRRRRMSPELIRFCLEAGSNSGARHAGQRQF
jgi:hypothetical protein